MEEEKIRICPKCGSTNTAIITHKDPIPFIGNISQPDTFKCENCDYLGIFPLVYEDEAEDIKKSIEEDK